jgi:predicted esterase
LLGTYFDNPNFTGTAVSRIDPNVKFRWDGYRPTSRIDTTTFSVRWEGQLQAPVTGDYSFYIKSDDGFRLWVGNLNADPVMSQWVDQTESADPFQSYDTVHLVAGQRYDIRLEYYQNEGAAMVELGWGGPFAPTIIPTSALFPAISPTLPPSSDPPPPTQAVGQLKVSADGHFVQKTDGSQFFWLADTAWALFNGTSRADVDYYLQARADQEFTVTQAVLYNPDAFHANAFGQPVFLNNNPATPNPTYFDHVDYVLDKAQTSGMYVAVLPSWGDGVAAGDGRTIINTSNAYAYGQWLGQRYANQANIIWVLGGDWPATTADVQATWKAMADGLRAGDHGTHLITYHPAGGQSSTDFFSQSGWLDFNTIQSGHNRDSANYDTISADYGLTPAKPTIDSEPNYEEIPNGLSQTGVPLDDYDVRKKTYWALFAGAFGAAYGNFGVYGFTNDTDYGRKPWKEALNDAGANQMKFAKRLLLSRPYIGRVPDQALVQGGTLAGTDHIQATRGGDGSYAFVYSASGKSFTVDLSRLSGTTITASWYNPRTGQATQMGEYSKSLGTKAFTPPTTGTGQDWVLVLDDKAKGYYAPGQAPPPPPPNSNPNLTGSVTGSVTDGVKTIPYRLYKPSGVPVGQKVPLILYLHGRDERGTDNVKHTTWLRGIVSNTKSGQYAAYVLAPQIDPSMWFQSYNGSETQAMKLTIQAVRQVMATENVDPSRIYVTGVSMGGMGAWDAIKWEPNLFAAAVPMSGYANPNTASTIKDIPIWAFHGSNDTIVNVSGTRNIINAIRAAGGTPKYTEVAGGGHVIWDPIYFDASNTLFPWLFGQRRAVPASAPDVPTLPPVTVPSKPAPKPTPKPTPKPAPKPVFATKPVAEKPKATAKKVETVFSSAPVATKAKAPAKVASAAAKK